MPSSLTRLFPATTLWPWVTRSASSKLMTRSYAVFTNIRTPRVRFGISTEIVNCTKQSQQTLMSLLLLSDMRDLWRCFCSCHECECIFAEDMATSTGFFSPLTPMYSVMIVFETPRPCNVLSDHFGRRRSRQPCPYRMVISILEAHSRYLSCIGFVFKEEGREQHAVV